VKHNSVSTAKSQEENCFEETRDRFPLSVFNWVEDSNKEKSLLGKHKQKISQQTKQQEGKS
jgi:hypothetical protein